MNGYYVQWKDPQVEVPEENPTGAPACVMVSTPDTQYPIKAWYCKEFGYTTATGYSISRSEIRAWCYYPQHPTPEDID